jgi:hypothetical protein
MYWSANTLSDNDLGLQFLERDMKGNEREQIRTWLADARTAQKAARKG